MHIIDASGNPRAVVSGRWYTGGGEWRPITNMALYVNGVWRQATALEYPASGSFYASDHLTITGIISAPDATALSVLADGVVIVTLKPAAGASVGISGTVTVTGRTPGSTVSMTMRVTRASGTTTTEPTLVTMPVMPAPASLSVVATSTTLALSWPAVPGTTSYEVTLTPALAAGVAVTNTAYTFTGLAPGTSVTANVRARFNASVVSAPRSTATATSTRFTAGVYTFSAASADTWKFGTGGWVGDTGNVFHGDGRLAGVSGGPRGAFFFGYTRSGQTIQQFFTGGGTVNVTKLEIYIKRNNTAHGLASEQLCRFAGHAHATKPTTPALSTTAVNTGLLNRGEGEWISLPLSWAPLLVAGTLRGIEWGAPGTTNGDRYMVGPNIATLASMGQLRFTVS